MGMLKSFLFLMVFSSVAYGSVHAIHGAGEALPTDPELLSLQQMDRLVERVESVYTPEFAAQGLTLKFVKKWDSLVKNATAERYVAKAVITIHAN